MNEALKAQHYESITDDKARTMYALLSEACERRDGGMTDTDQMLVCDIARAEQIKQMLIADILERGVGRQYSNGRQKYYQENKSIAQLRSQSEQQRKGLAELRLTPGSRKAPFGDFDAGDDFDQF